MDPYDRFQEDQVRWDEWEKYDDAMAISDSHSSREERLAELGIEE